MTKNATGQIGQDPQAAFGKEGPKPKPEPKPQEATQEEAVEAEEEAEAEAVFSLSDDPETRLNQVADLLKEQYEDAPTAAQLMQWKANHGDVFILPVAEKTYIYRYLKRLEWVKMQTEEQFGNMNPLETEEYVFDKCLLWPTINPLKKATLPAGLISTLSDQIRLNSMFLNPEALAQMTIKL